MTKEYQLYIGGQWINASTGTTDRIINPADESLVGIVQNASATDAHKALLAAQEAQKSWRRLPVKTNPIMDLASTVESS